MNIGVPVTARLEFMLAVLVGRGATVADAMTWSALIDRHIVGSGLQDAEESRAERRAGLTDAAAWRSGLAEVLDLAVSYGDLPHLTSWLAAPSGPSPDARFALGLGYLLDGIDGVVSAP